MYDYSTLDASWRFHYRQQKLRLAHSLGYDHITEMFHRLYVAEKSTRRVAEVVGVSPDNARRVLLYIGVPMMPRGGKHTAILTPEIVKALRDEWKRVAYGGTYKNHFVRDFRERRLLPVSDRCLENALDGYTWGAINKEMP